MKNSILLLIALCWCITLFSQEKTYYYFNDTIVNIPINTQRVYVYYKNSPDALKNLIDECGLIELDKDDQFLDRYESEDKKIAAKQFGVRSDDYYNLMERLHHHRDVVSVQKTYGMKYPTPTGNCFYVNLKSPARYEEMVAYALETGTIVKRRLDMGNWYELETTKESAGDALDCSNLFYESGMCEGVAPGFLIKYKRMDVVSDSEFDKQWAINGHFSSMDIHASEAWDITKGNSNVTVAVFDEGIYQEHREFENTSFVSSYNAKSGMPEGHVFHSHGTEVAGVIAANHNQYNIAGVAPEVSIMDISFSTGRDEIQREYIIRGFLWAGAHDADIINCSWGARYDEPGCKLGDQYIINVMDSLLEHGRNGLGCVIVFASGNDSISHCSMPGNQKDGILVVGAVDSIGIRAHYSNYGEKLDVVAPGSSIYTTYYDPTLFNTDDCGTYTTVSGTSFAAPHVSAIAALILSVAPQLTGQQVVHLIQQSAQKINYTFLNVEGKYDGTWNNEVGYGLVDAYAALATDINEDFCHKMVNVDGCYVNIGDCLLNYDSEFVVKCYVCTQITGKFEIERGGQFLVNTSFQIY